MKDLKSFELGKFVLIFFCISASNSLCEQAQSLNAGHDLDARVDGILSQLTPSQKLDYIGGTGFFDVKPVPPVANFPGEFNPQIYQTDGPLGARRNSPSVRFPSGLTLAATWNPALAYEQGAAMGEDVRARGYFAIEGPSLNLYRVPLNGRNFEYVAGEDPYLGSQFAPAEIMGIQSKGVWASAKHLVWDEEKQKWLAAPGIYRVYVGRASDDIKLSESFSISQEIRSDP